MARNQVLYDTSASCVTWLKEQLRAGRRVRTTDAIREKNWWRLPRGVHYLRAAGWEIRTIMVRDSEADKPTAEYSLISEPTQEAA